MIDEHGYRVVGPAQAMVDYAQPLFKLVEGDGEEALQNAFSLVQVFWNLAVTKDDVYGAEIRREVVRKMQKMGFAQSDELIDFMIARHQRMFPYGGKSGFYLRERVIDGQEPWVMFDESALSPSSAPAELDADDQATKEVFASVDATLSAGECEVEDAVLSGAAEKFRASFPKWLQRIGIPVDAAMMLAEAGDGFLCYLYKYTGEQMNGDPESEVREFFLAWGFRKANFCGCRHSAAPTALAMMGRYFDELGHTKGLANRMFSAAAECRDELLELLPQWYGPAKTMPKDKNP